MSQTADLRNELEAKLAAKKAMLAAQRLKVDMNTLNQITSSKAFTENVVRIIGEFLARKYELDNDNQFCVISSIAQLNTLLQKSQNFLDMPIFVVYNGFGNHWVTFCISKSADDGVKVFYQDYYSMTFPDSLKIVFSTNLAPIPVDFSCQIDNFSTVDSPCQCDGHICCGPMSLKNSELMIQRFKADNSGFYETLRTLSFSSPNEVLSIQTDFKLELVESTVDKILEGFEPNLQTTENLKNFIEFTLKTHERLGEKVGSYVEVLQEEMRKQETGSNYEFDLNAISKARNAFNSNLKGFDKDIEQIAPTLKDVMPEYNDGYTVDPTLNSNAEINKNNYDKKADETINDSMLKLNTALEKFTFIFKCLSGTVETEKLNNLLKNLGIKFGIEQRLLKYFLKVERKMQQTLIKKVTLEAVVPLSADELFKCLPSKKDKSPSSYHKVKSTLKSLEQLLAEVALGRDMSNEAIRIYSSDDSKHFFAQKYSYNMKVLELERKFHVIKRYTDVWKDKDIFAIRDWADKMRRCKLTKNSNDPIILETIAIMNRAFELTTGEHTFRYPQIISILEFLTANEKEGKLCEISTGEGKTIIIAVLASIKVLQGDVMDVITSNSILATEGVESTRMFYDVFGISVTTNNESETGIELKARPCYKADVVYGTISNFQFDYLRDTFEGYKTRAGRAFGCVILDEVDNLAIDNGSYIAKLAGPFPGMESLKYVYIKIWQELAKAEASVSKGFDQKIQEKAEKIKNLCESGQMLEDVAQKEYENFKFELFGKQISSLKSKILTSNPTKIGLIPRHLKEYCESMLEKWVENALYAKCLCNENENYVIKKKSGELCIIPVDFQNTGVTLKNTIWCSGLHQFVQLKHNLQLTSESLTSSFISNIGYIKFYNNRIFGLTGTLGSEAERDLLSAAYNLTFAVIPRFKPKLIVEYEGMVVRDSQWLNLVSIESFILAVKGRSVLIICETIRDLRNFEKNFKSLLVLEGKSDQVKIKLYADEDGSTVVGDKVGPSEIIIATNIAGRGTDFNTTDELEKNGGLHVVLSFLPCNKRVQDQAFGRTARQGRVGSAQLIIRESDLTELDLKMDFDDQESVTMEVVLKKRDVLERCRLEQIKNEKLAKIDFQDILFSKFSELYSEFKKKQIKKLGGLFLAEDLKEFWAFWLHKKYFKDKKLNEIEETFNQFKEDAKDILSSGDVEGKIHFNPYYSIRQAEYFIQNNEIKEAEKCVETAISLSGNFAPLFYSAYFKLFEIEIEKGGQMLERFRIAVAKVFFIKVDKDETYKEKAKVALEKASRALETKIKYIKENFFSEEGEKSKISKDFHDILVGQQHENILVKHINARLVALSTYYQHAQSLLKQLEDSSKDDKDTKGLSINSRLPYLKQLDDKNQSEKDLKALLTDESIAELESVGLETIYAFREVHDASSEVITGAQIQIGGGLAALAVGLAFLPILPIMGPIAGALISEGVCDIVIELISKGQTGFDVASYVKGKCISFGIAVATMGISAIATSIKILNQAVKACKDLVSLLRKCPYLKGVCEKMATHLEKLGKYFEKQRYLAEFKKLGQGAQLQQLKELKAAGQFDKWKALGGLKKFKELEHLKDMGKLDIVASRVYLLKSTLGNIGKETLQSTVGTIISEKIVNDGLSKILGDLQPVIEQKVRKAFEADIHVSIKLRSIEKDYLPAILNDIFIGTYGEMAVDVLKEIALGVLRHSKNWKLKIASVAIDSVISVTEIVKYVEHFRSKFLKAEPVTMGIVNDDFIVLQDMTELIITQVSSHIFTKVMQLAGRHAHTFLVAPLMTKLWSLGGRETKKSETEEEEARTFAEITEAYDILGVRPGASIEEVKQAYKKAALKNHPDRQGGDIEIMQKVVSSYSLIKNLHEEISSRHFYQSQHNGHMKLFNNGVEIPQVIPKYDDTSEPAHKGNISTISKEIQQHIIVRYENKIHEFGTRYKDSGKESLVVDYNPPSADLAGHYSIPAEVIAKLTEKGVEVSLQPSGANNCLYDALVPQINVQNNSNLISAQDLRDISEKLSLANITANLLYKASDLLNNPITRRLHIKARQGLLVGGNLEVARDLRDGFIETIKSIVPLIVEAEDVTLNNICKTNENAVMAIIAHSNAFYEFKRDPEVQNIAGVSTIDASFLSKCDAKTLNKIGINNKEAVRKIMAHSAKIKAQVNQKLTLYKIENFDDLTSFIVNFNYDKNKAAPMAVRFPNGDTAVFGEDLYCMVAHTDRPTGKKLNFYVADSQYLGKNLPTVDDALKALTDKDSHLNIIEYMPEICGRIISESIRNKSTFVSACLALLKNQKSPLCGNDAYRQSLPVTAITGIKWEKNEDKEINNPDHLLYLHYLRCSFNNKITDLLENKNEKLENNGNNELQNKLYKKVYGLAKRLLEQGEC